MWLMLALGKATRGVLRFSWRPALAVLALVSIWAIIPGQGREAVTGWFVLAGLLALAVAEVIAWHFGPEVWRNGFLRRRSVWIASWLKVQHATREHAARRAGNRLLRASGLIPDTMEDMREVRFFQRPNDGRAPYAFIPPLVGIGPDRVQAAMETVAWQIAGAGCTVAVEPVAAIGLMIVRFRRAPANLPDVVPYPLSGLRPTVDRLPVGVDESGAQVTIRLRESNALVAGLPGGGKSAFLNALITSAVACGPSVALYGVDPKRVELAAWRGTFARIATEDDGFLPLLNDLADEMNSRYSYLEQHGMRKFETFDAAHPLIVLVIDEMAEVVSSADSKRDKAHAAAIRLLVQKGRAAGVSVIGATQRPSSDVIPTSLRDLFVQRVAFATSTVEMSRMILGDGARSDEPGPESIGASERGVGFATSDGDRGLTRFKAYWVSDEAVKSIVDSLPANGSEVLSA